MPASGSALATATDTALANPEVKNLIFGEVVHADNSFFTQFVSVEHMDSLKKNGVTEIAIELPANLQFSADWLLKGERTPEQFKQNMKNMFQFFDMDEATADERRQLIVDMLQRANERGIKVKFVDGMKGTNEMDELRKPENQNKLVTCLETRMGAMTEAELDAMAKNFGIELNKLTGQCLNQDPELKKIGEQFEKQRFEDDKKLGADAAARNPNGRTVFFFGNAHGASIAAGHPGKSQGIVGVFDQNSDGIRKMTPFFFYHFNIESGEVKTPSWWNRLFSAAPEQPALSPQPA